MIPEVNKWYLTGAKKHANNPSHWSWENQEKFYKSKVDKSDNNDVFVWSVFLKPEYTNSGYEEVIGQVSAQENGEDITIRDVGWYMDPAYQGKGYATEAAKTMIDYMFKEVEINGISSVAVKDNIGSCRIFEKLGFNEDKVQVLINRYMENDEINAEDVEEVLGKKLYWKIPNNYFTMMSAINKGVPVTDINSDSNVALSFKNLALLVSDSVYRQKFTKKVGKVQ